MSEPATNLNPEAAVVEEAPMEDVPIEAGSDPLVKEVPPMPPPQTEPQKSYLFHSMAAFPWPYLVVLPILYILLISFGWTQDDYIEDEVAKIWIPTEGDYAQDQSYAKQYGRDDLSASAFAAMAISRDGTNLFTADRLEQVKARMELTENTTIEHNGVTFTWDDLCAKNDAGSLGTTYEFPCARISPLDLFQEARWFFDETDRLTWYHEIVRPLLIHPRLPRVGIMSTTCAGACQHELALRFSADYAEANGYPRAYASPLGLAADVGNMEMNHPCRQCIETAYEAQIDQLHQLVQGAFTVLGVELQRTNATLTDPNDRALVQDLMAKSFAIATTTTRQDVADFNLYLTTRGLYATLGVTGYMEGYAGLRPLLEQCIPGLLECPPIEITPADAQAALLAHADNQFSSITTAGSPLPFWSNGDGTGVLLEGNQPVSGSGINMSQNVTSLAAYLDLFNYGNPSAWNPLYEGGAAGFADPVTPGEAWQTYVEPNPLYSWFMAGLTPAYPGQACGNETLPGTNLSIPEVDAFTAQIMKDNVTQYWCTDYNVPNADIPNGSDVTYTKQHFARMWYDLLTDSEAFLGIEQGVDDPYTWTTGQGCGYVLGGDRDTYKNETEDDILTRASRELYYVDEGETIGVVDRNLLIGDVVPAIGEYNFSYPLQHVGVIQTLYAALLPPDIVERVKNCNRPDGPVNLTQEDAEEVLYKWKEAMEDTWTQDWDDENAGDVQFVAFFDDGGGVVGTTGRLLRDITLDNATLTAISIIFIAFFSVVFLAGPDWIESRALITLIGVSLVVLAYFAAVGLGILIGININVTIAWTLPFIILGLGVDDVYIVLMGLKRARTYSENSYIRAMKEVIVPVTMTSLVNCSAFAILNISDIPAVYLTAQVAIICVIALYLAVVFCFPAYCYLDMKRQEAGRYDFFFCFKKPVTESVASKKKDFRDVWLYDKVYKPIVLNEKVKTRVVWHTLIWLGALALFACGSWGLTEHVVGLGLEDFFPTDNPASTWANVRTEELASWSIGMNWGALNYTDPGTQLAMINQFEEVVATPHVAEKDTKFLWIADLAIWSSRHCTDNFDRSEASELECGRNQYHNETQSFCAGSWVRNNGDFSLREKIFADPRGACQPYEGGICRPTKEMFQEDLDEAGYDPLLDSETVWCPVMDWSDEKFKFCLETWRAVTNYDGGRFVLQDEHGTPTDCDGEYYRDESLVWPMPYTAAPTLFSFDLQSHELTLEMMDQTRDICDRHPTLHCWMTGIPFDYWTQYEGIFGTFTELTGWCCLIGFGISFAFLLGKIGSERRFSTSRVVGGSLIGSLLIVLTMILSLVAVSGLSILADVSLTGFSNMSFVLSVAFAVEYSVHIVARYLRAPNRLTSGKDRVEYTMSFLTLPMFMAFVSSTIGVVCLAFTEFEFNRVYFFRPLIICMCVTYFYGSWWLPCVLSYMNWDVVQLGKPASEPESLYLTTSVAAKKQQHGALAVDEESETHGDHEVLPHSDSPSDEASKEGDDDENDSSPAV